MNIKGLGRPATRATCCQPFGPQPATPSSRSGIRRMGVALALCLVLAGCDKEAPPRPDTLRQCRMLRNNEEFYYMTSTEQAGGPWASCLFVTDADGFNRFFCPSGPDAAICRDVPPPPGFKVETRP